MFTLKKLARKGLKWCLEPHCTPATHLWSAVFSGPLLSATDDSSTCSRSVRISRWAVCSREVMSFTVHSVDKIDIIRIPSKCNLTTFSLFYNIEGHFLHSHIRASSPFSLRIVSLHWMSSSNSLRSRRSVASSRFSCLIRWSRCCKRICNKKHVTTEELLNWG